jgi:hypothetical protein
MVVLAIVTYLEGICLSARQGCLTGICQVIRQFNVPLFLRLTRCTNIEAERNTSGSLDTCKAVMISSSAPQTQRPTLSIM